MTEIWNVFVDFYWLVESFSKTYAILCIYNLQVEDGNPHVVWSASEDGTLRQHDFRDGVLCPPAGSTNQECRNILVSFGLFRTFCKSDFVSSFMHNSEFII
jgi:hypothetical protein